MGRNSSGAGEYDIAVRTRERDEAEAFIDRVKRFYRSRGEMLDPSQYALDRDGTVYIRDVPMSTVNKVIEGMLPRDHRRKQFRVETLQ